MRTVRAGAALLLSLLAPPLFAAEGGVLTPSPFPSPLRRPWARETTVFSRREVVLNTEAGFAPTERTEAAVRSLSSNIVVPALGDRIRYSFYEAEGEGKVLLLDGRPRGGPSLALAGFLNRFWLKADDGLGARRALRRTFFGAKALAEVSRGRFTGGAALRAMGVEEDRGTAVTLGPSVRWRLTGALAVVAEAHPFLRNPLRYKVPWGWGFQWNPEGPLGVALSMSNAYGVTTPDTFAGSSFPQYHLRVSAHF